MTCEKLFAAVLISIIFTDLKSQVRNPTRTYRRPWDIAKFVSRGQPIWTYKTTEHTDKSCKVDIVRHASEVFVTFNRSYDYHGQRPNIQMLGRFDLTNRAEIRIGRVVVLDTVHKGKQSRLCQLVLTSHHCQKKSSRNKDFMSPCSPGLDIHSCSSYGEPTWMSDYSTCKCGALSSPLNKRHATELCGKNGIHESRQ
ncbi:uncharacterized protein [Dermacentor albipictus]|uniref:uncharacterized protein isoform X1 n=1 Tax=Dermacentor albipictus TaxID=60249 RepID=UPI0038FC010D